MNVEGTTTKRSREDFLTKEDVVTKEMKKEDVAPLPRPPEELTPGVLIKLEEECMPQRLQIAPQEEVEIFLQKERRARILSWREEVMSQSATAKHQEITDILDEQFYNEATTRGVEILGHALLTTEAWTLEDCIALQFRKRHEKRRLPIWYAIDYVLKRESSIDYVLKVKKPSETTQTLVTGLQGRLLEWVSEYFTNGLMQDSQQGHKYDAMVHTWERCMPEKLYDSIIGIVGSKCK